MFDFRKGIRAAGALLGLGLALMSTAGDAGAQAWRANPARAGLDQAQLGRITDHFSQRAHDGARSGYVILVVRDGIVGYAAAIGQSDLADAAPMTMDTEFRIASLTKPVVSAAVMRLVDRGDIRLVDPVARYLPEFANMRVGVSVDASGQLVTAPANRPITIFDLLSHTAGLGAGGHPEYPAAQEYVRRYPEFFQQGSVADASRWIASLPLVYQPGEAWGYSFSLDVLARIIEVRTGQPIEQALRALVFEPLGMRHTYYNQASADRSRVATLYSTAREGGLVAVENSMLDTIPFPMSGGGLISTADDYMRFLRMMLGKGQLDGVRVLSEASVGAMTRNVLPASQRPIRLELNMMGAGFGLGFGVIADDQATQSLLAPGDYFWAGATDTFAFVSPSRNMAAIVLSQYWPNENTREWDTMYDFINMTSAAVLTR